jgi:uncharacterized protein YjiS (DUF1127 family)
MSFHALPLGLDRGTAGSAGRSSDRLRAGLARAILTLLRWQELARQRRALLKMDDRMLKDIGVSRADAVREAGRRFWDERDEPWQPWH